MSPMPLNIATSRALLRYKEAEFIYNVNVAALQATTPKFTFAAGAPAAYVGWGDGTAQSAVTSGVELSHTYAAAGMFTVKLIMPNQATYLTQVDINSDKVVSVVTPIQMFPKLTVFYAHVNVAWTQNISGWVVLPLLIEYSIRNTSIVGNISTLSSIQYLYASDCLLNGDVSNLVISTSMRTFDIFNTLLTGCPILSSMVNIRYIRAQDCNLSQATVDLWLSRCVAVEAQTTYATPTLNLGGTNAAPSAAGIADVGTLVAAGWIVTVTGAIWSLDFSNAINSMYVAVL